MVPTSPSGYSDCIRRCERGHAGRLFTGVPGCLPGVGRDFRSVVLRLALPLRCGPRVDRQAGPASAGWALPHSPEGAPIRNPGSVYPPMPELVGRWRAFVPKRPIPQLHFPPGLEGVLRRTCRVDACRRLPRYLVFCGPSLLSFLLRGRCATRRGRSCPPVYYPSRRPQLHRLPKV